MTSTARGIVVRNYFAACLEEGDGDIVMEEDDQIVEIPEISLHAISGTCAPEIMQVMGSLGHVAVSDLVDSGSTHNFVSEKVAQKIGLKPLFGGRFEVVVASVEKLVSPGKCTDVQLNLQGVPISYYHLKAMMWS